jgi:MFS family permease
MRRILADYILDVKAIQRNIRLFLIGGLLMGIMNAFQQLLLNLYFKEVGHGEAFIGTVLSQGAIGGVVAAIPAAYLVARFKIRPLLIISTILLVLSFLVLSTSPREWLILPSAFAVGLLMAVKNVSSGPVIMRNTTEHERTLVFSLNFSTWIVAGIVGSVAGGWLHDVFFDLTQDGAKAYQYALIVAAAFGLLAVIPFSMIKSRVPNPDDVARSFSWKSLKAKKNLFIKLTLPYAVLGTGAGLIIPFLNLYFKLRFHLDTARIGVYFSILQLSMLAAVLIVPIMKRRIGFIRTVVFTEIASIPFMLILCYTNSLNMAFWAFLFRGAIMNMSSPVSTTFMMESVAKEDHGLINSLSSIAWAGAWAISTQIGGAMIEKQGFVNVFLLAIGLYIVSAGLYFYFFSRSEVREGERIVIDTGSMR